MKEILKNKKIIYAILSIIIIIGIIVTCVFKLNFSLLYSQNTRINLYIGKEYNIDDIKNIAQEVFGTKDIAYQKIEKFNEAVSIIVKEASDEQVENLKTKIQEKYQIETTDNLVKEIEVAHFRLRDMIKPYIIPVVISTAILLIYIVIKYIKLGVIKVILTLILRLAVVEAVAFSIIAICRLHVGIYTMPILLAIYVLVTLLTTMGYENELEKILIEEDKKKK